VKLGSNVNGSATHFPFITADAGRLYVSAAESTSPYGSNEDVYVCHWDSVIGDWGPRQLLAPEINTIQRELSPCESPDRQYLWFIRYAGGYDLFYSIWDTAAAKWGPAVNAGPQFNSPCIEWSVSISPDGRRMFLVHGIRPGTIGCERQVLWISYWNDATQWWDTLIWMGNVLNRAVPNYAATMSFDTSSMYFASGMGWPGVPKFGVESDLFAVRNTALSWDDISNLGMPPNSYDREEGISISADGRYLYFSSYRDSTKLGPDIYVSERSVSVGESPGGVKPVSFSLSSPRPNPFNSAVDFEVTVTSTDYARIGVRNILGQHVVDLYTGVLSAGSHRFTWDAHHFSSGVYLLFVEIGEQRQIRKALLMK